MYLTETDPTHTCSVAIVTNPSVAEDGTGKYETKDGERYLEEYPEYVEHIPTSIDVSERVVGRYRLKRSLGRGVTGSVWHAQDVDSADRDVALKIMHADVHDEYVMARYTCEVRALARMDDPHIARIWENGQTTDGKLYIAMELVNGVQLSKYCEAWSPTIRERIALLVKLCRGMQHAHQRGILHRDLKPANILVTVQEHQVIPKIIDFGLAKSFHKPLRPGTADTTQMGCLLGTIGYMSPEQANTSIRDVDTRSDVYSLCAILYELLTGTLPIPREELHQVSLARALEMIQHREPDGASKRVLKNPHSVMHAARCQVTPVKLASMLRGDLDAILEKGLSKEKERRYQSAGDLADDLERYLNGGMVQARPRTAWYVAQKLLRRHWKMALAVGVISLMFLVSWFGLAFGIYQAITERNRAQLAETSLTKSEKMERRHREDAESSNKFLESVFSYTHPGMLGHEIKLLEALEWASTSVSKSFKEQPGAEALVRLTLARSYLRLGRSHRAQLLLEPLVYSMEERYQDLQVQRLQGQVLMVQSLLDQEQLDQSEQLCRKAIADLLKTQPTWDAELRSLNLTLANVMVKKQNFPEAISLLQKSLQSYAEQMEQNDAEEWALRGNLLSVYLLWARKDPAMASLALAMARQNTNLADALPEQSPMALQIQCQLAEALFLNGQSKDSYQVLEHAFDVASFQFGKDHLYSQTIQSNLAQLYLDEGLNLKAEKILKDVVVQQLAMLSAGHPATQKTLQHLVNFYRKQDKQWHSLANVMQLYEGQRMSLGLSHKKSEETRQTLMDVMRATGSQWLIWSIGG